MLWRISSFLLVLLAGTALAAENWPQPAARFQLVYSQIITGAPSSEWRTELATLAHLTGTNTVEKSVREVSRVWLARVQLPELDAALRHYYRFNARFPTTLDAIEPATLRTDPWGDPWNYRLRSPKGLERLTAQRYQVTPKRYPLLISFEKAIKDRKTPAPHWKITVREFGNSRALEVGNALIQPGSPLDGYTLLFIGEHISLWAGLDELFAISF
jgi:hypothetical protein